MNDRLSELLRAQAPGQPMGDELIELLAEELVTDGGKSPAHALDDALRVLMGHAIRLVETLHEIRKP